MGRYIIILIILTWSYGSQAEKNPIYNQILRNKVHINKQYAMKLSNIIHVVSKRVGVDPKILTAIMAQESMYDNKAKNCITGLDDLYQTHKLCNDFGIMQINHKTAKAYDISLYKVINDLEYSVEVGVKILKWFQKTYKNDPDWYTRFNCGTRGTTLRDTCQRYKALVSRYF